MSFNDLEISTQDGRPIALYTLRWDKTYWRYTSADRDVVRTELVDGDMVDVTYSAKAVSDEGMVQGSSSQNNFTLNAPSSLPIVDLYRGTPPAETIWLTVRRQHFGDTDAPIYWIGTVSNVQNTDLASSKIIGKPLSASFKRTGLRLCWTKECPHFLYDSDCAVAMEDFKTVAIVNGLTGNGFTVDTVSGQPDHWFQGGLLSWEANADGTIERRMIQDQEGTTFTIFGTTDRLLVGTSVNLYPGCDRTPVTCDDKFDNKPNFGGFDFMPGKTPFGTQVF